jgi:hypothetical protein
MTVSRVVFLALLLAVIVTGQTRVSVAADLISNDRPIHEVIDHYIDEEIKGSKISPVDQASEVNLIRRLTLDLVGRIPASCEVHDFTESNASDKRSQLIDRLMSTSEYSEHQATMLNTFITQGRGGILDYLKLVVQENRGWDQIFQDILLAKHSDEKQKQAIDFLKQRAKDSDQLTVDVSVVFFGVNIGCAKCHDHPLVEGWKQEHFYGMKSFFNRTFENGGFIAERGFGNVSFKTTEGETKQAKLLFLSGAVIDEPDQKELSKDEQKKESALFKKLAKEKKPPPEPKYSRRAQLVEVALKSDSSHFLPRAIVNRIWHQYFGYGIVMPLDQMHSSNEPSHPELLEWLARDFVEHQYDLRRLVRGLVMSKAYSLGSAWSAEKRPDREYFAVANVRALTPAQLARSLSLATSDPASFQGDIDAKKLVKRIAGAAGTSNSSQFEEPREDFQVSANEALWFNNSEQVRNRYLKGGLFNRLKQIDDLGEVITTAYWTVLTRAPSENEIKLTREYIGKREDRRDQAFQQVIWALLTSSEFRFNH